MPSAIKYICAAALVAWICPAQPRPALEATPAATLAFTEGPAADTAGNVYFTDFTSRRISEAVRQGRVRPPSVRTATGPMAWSSTTADG